MSEPKFDLEEVHQEYHGPGKCCCAYNQRVSGEIERLRNRITELEEYKIERIRCSQCGKSVSNPVVPSATDGLIIRAWVECPECVQAKDD